LPPDLVEHLSNADRPRVYYWFWGLGALCFIVTVAVLSRRIRSFYSDAVKLRAERGEALLSSSYITCILIVCFPVVASFCKFSIFVSPINGHTIDFVLETYEGVVLYSFTRLLLQFLGSLDALCQDAPKTKFYAAPPLGCCFAPLVEPSLITLKDFRILHTLIVQFCVLAPLLSFSAAVREIEGDHKISMALEVIEVLSAMICFYGLLALLRASSPLLERYKIKSKFWSIKGLVVVMVVPSSIMELVGDLPEESEHYDQDTLRAAYAAMVSLVLLVGLSVVILLNFTPEDARSAMDNMGQSQSRKILELSTKKTTNEEQGDGDGRSKDTAEHDGGAGDVQTERGAL